MDDQTQISLTRAELKSLLEEAVQDAFTKMGMDVTDPIEMQRDFQHLREWRVAAAAVRKKGLLTLVGIIVAGSAAAFWLGFKAMMVPPS